MHAVSKSDASNEMLERPYITLVVAIRLLCSLFKVRDPKGDWEDQHLKSETRFLGNQSLALTPSLQPIPAFHSAFLLFLKHEVIIISLLNIFSSPLLSFPLYF